MNLHSDLLNSTTITLELLLEIKLSIILIFELKYKNNLAESINILKIISFSFFIFSDIKVIKGYFLFVSSILNENTKVKLFSNKFLFKG